MTTRRKTTNSGKGEANKLKLSKRTLKDLSAEGKGVKGGGLPSRFCGSGSGV